MVTVRLTNESAETITIARYPVSFEARSPDGDGGCLPARAGDDVATDRHVRLPPSGSIEFEALVDRHVLAADAEDRDLRLGYAGKPWFEKEKGPPATPPTWFGWLPVRFGPLWKGIDEPSPGAGEDLLPRDRSR